MPYFIAISTLFDRKFIIKNNASGDIKTQIKTHEIVLV